MPKMYKLKNLNPQEEISNAPMMNQLNNALQAPLIRTPRTTHLEGQMIENILSANT